MNYILYIYYVVFKAIYSLIYYGVPVIGLGLIIGGIFRRRHEKKLQKKKTASIVMFIIGALMIALFIAYNVYMEYVKAQMDVILQDYYEIME